MNKETFHDSVRNNERPVVVDFWAPWCMPCRAMEPALKRVEQMYHGKVDLWRINTDENPELARELGIMGIPTMIAFKDGVQIARHTGGQSDAGIQQMFEAALAGRATAPASIRPLDRVVRLTAGLILIAFAFQPGFSWVWAVLGAMISFSAVYDRCPVWKAITSRFRQNAE